MNNSNLFKKKKIINSANPDPAIDVCFIIYNRNSNRNVPT